MAGINPGTRRVNKNSKTCVWCGQLKKNNEIHALFRTFAICKRCETLSIDQRMILKKEHARQQILNTLKTNGALSTADLGRLMIATVPSMRSVARIASLMVSKGQLERLPHPAKKVWLWRLPDSIPEPLEATPEPDSIPEPLEATPEPDSKNPTLVCEGKPSSTVLTGESGSNTASLPENSPDDPVMIVFLQLKRSQNSIMAGITDDDLLWQAHYQVQAAAKKQRAAVEYARSCLSLESGHPVAVSTPRPCQPESRLPALRVLAALESGPLLTIDLAAQLNMTSDHTSNVCRYLRQRGLIDSRRISVWGEKVKINLHWRPQHAEQAYQRDLICTNADRQARQGRRV